MAWNTFKIVTETVQGEVCKKYLNFMIRGMGKKMFFSSVKFNSTQEG